MILTKEGRGGGVGETAAWELPEDSHGRQEAHRAIEQINIRHAGPLRHGLHSGPALIP